MHLLNGGPPPTTTSRTTKDALPPLRRLAWSDARKSLKPHVGYEAFVGRLIAIAEAFADELGTGGFDVERLRTAPATIEALEAERRVAAERLAYLESTLFIERSQLWTEMLAIYARAKAAARTSIALRGALEPFVLFMRKGKRKKPVSAA